MRPVDVRTPVATGDAQQVGKGLWRKQVLPIGQFKVGDRTLEFTRNYCRQVADAFTAGAYPTVPVMLADKDNNHTMEFTAEGGEVLALEDADDGLYATVKLSEPEAEKRVDRNRRCGVSVQIRENFERSDGQFYPAALRHLLLTWDGRIPMKPWEPINLSNSDDEPHVVMLDLSSMTYEQTPTSEGAPTMADLTDEELAQVRALLQRLQDDKQPAAAGDANTELSEEDYQRLAEEIFGEIGDDAEEGDEGGQSGDADENTNTDEEDQPDTGEGDGAGNAPNTEQDTPQAVAASNTGGDVVELANAARDTERAQILELTARLDAANYEKERDQIVRATGLPPSIVDLARPVLEGSRNVVELSNGTSVDAGDVVRKVLHAVGQKVQLLDLSAALGTDEPDDKAKAEAEHRDWVTKQVMQYIN